MRTSHRWAIVTVTHSMIFLSFLSHLIDSWHLFLTSNILSDAFLLLICIVLVTMNESFQHDRNNFLFQEPKQITFRHTANMHRRHLHKITMQICIQSKKIMNPAKFDIE